MQETSSAGKESSTWPTRGLINTALDQLTHYTACVFEPGDIVEVRRLPSGKSTWHRADELAKAAGFLAHDNQHGQHIYVGANPRRVEGGTRGKDVTCACCLFADFDGITTDEAKSRWHDACFPEPTMTVASGHGVHAYWRLSEPVFDMDLWSKLQKRLIALLGSDAAIHDPARIMRLPGFINHKEPVAECYVIENDHTRRFDVKSLMSLLYSAITESDYTAQYLAASKTTQSKRLLPDNISAVKIAKLAAAKWPGVTRGGRNCKAFQNAAYLIKNLALTEEQAWPVLQQWNCRNRPPLPARELRQTLRNANVYGRHKAVG